MSKWHQTPHGKWYLKCYNAAYHANLKAKEMGAVGILTRLDVESLLTDAACFYCGLTPPKSAQTGRGPRHDCLTIDHRVPLAEGGSNTVANLVASCHSCNVTKGVSGLSPNQWAQRFHRCIICSTTDVPHEARGMCRTCYSREYSKVSVPGHRDVFLVQKRDGCTRTISQAEYAREQARPPVLICCCEPVRVNPLCPTHGEDATYGKWQREKDAEK